MPDTEFTAVVYAENGKPVKMRAKPSTSCKTYWEIPCGTIVGVLKEGEEWTQISYNDKEGYMMTQFLRLGESNETEPVKELVEVIIPNLTQEQAKELIKKYPEAYMTVG